MRFKVRYNPEFLNDLKCASDWYEEKQKGLGSELIQMVKKQTLKLS